MAAPAQRSRNSKVGAYSDSQPCQADPIGNGQREGRIQAVMGGRHHRRARQSHAPRSCEPFNCEQPRPLFSLTGANLFLQKIISFSTFSSRLFTRRDSHARNSDETCMARESARDYASKNLEVCFQAYAGCQLQQATQKRKFSDI